MYGCITSTAAIVRAEAASPTIPFTSITPGQTAGLTTAMRHPGILSIVAVTSGTILETEVTTEIITGLIVTAATLEDLVQVLKFGTTTVWKDLRLAASVWSLSDKDRIRTQLQLMVEAGMAERLTMAAI